MALCAWSRCAYLAVGSSAIGVVVVVVVAAVVCERAVCGRRACGFSGTRLTCRSQLRRRSVSWSAMACITYPRLAARAEIEPPLAPPPLRPEAPPNEREGAGGGDGFLGRDEVRLIWN